MKYAFPILGAVGSLLITVPIQAHHSQAPFYDQEGFVEIHGVVTRFEFINPHPHVYVEVMDEQGEKLEWAIQFANRTNMRKRGWTADTLKPGAVLTAVGHPSKAPGTYGMQGATITLEDGTVLIRGSSQPPE